MGKPEPPEGGPQGPGTGCALPASPPGWSCACLSPGTPGSGEAGGPESLVRAAPRLPRLPVQRRPQHPSAPLPFLCPSCHTRRDGLVGPPRKPARSGVWRARRPARSFLLGLLLQAQKRPRGPGVVSAPNSRNSRSGQEAPAREEAHLTPWPRVCGPAPESPCSVENSFLRRQRRVTRVLPRRQHHPSTPAGGTPATRAPG